MALSHWVLPNLCIPLMTLRQSIIFKALKDAAFRKAMISEQVRYLTRINEIHLLLREIIKYSI